MGLLVALVAAYALRQTGLPTHWCAVLILVSSGCLMIGLELLLFHTHRNTSAGLQSIAAGPVNWERVARKVAAIWLLLGALAIAYWLFPLYDTAYYRNFTRAFWPILPIIVLLVPLYVGFIDRRQDEPEDAFAQLGSMLGGQIIQDKDMVRHLLLSWLVKAYCMPFMFVFLCGNLQLVWATGFELGDFDRMFRILYHLAWYVDVVLGNLGYILTLRILDSHIRSVDTSPAGWVVCLVCYPPFWESVGARFLPYNTDRLNWQHFMDFSPVLYHAWGLAVLLALAVYVWAIASFGLRFSNLTNRGIITNGPYRWTKHPSYISKGTLWWLSAVPFLSVESWVAALQSCLMLAGVNLIYFMRARAEERHLSGDASYQQYAAFIERHGLFAIVRNWVRLPVGVGQATRE